MAFDPYAILGVPQSANQEEIKQAYHRSARKYHPDVNHTEEARILFREISDAFTILSNPQQKKLYDTYGEVAFRLGFDLRKIKQQLSHNQPRNTDGLSAILGGSRRRIIEQNSNVGDLDLLVPLKIDRTLAQKGGELKVVSPLGGGMLTVSIPANIPHGAHIRLVGKGRVSVNGQRPGDLYFEISIAE